MDDECLKTLRRLTSEITADKSNREITFDDAKFPFTARYLQVVIDNIDEMVAIFNPKLEIIIMNKTLFNDLTALGLKPAIGKNWYDIIKVQPDSNEPIARAMRERDVIVSEWQSPNTKFKYRYICIPLLYDGMSAVLGIAKRI
jgi:hypothetical protein